MRTVLIAIILAATAALASPPVAAQLDEHATLADSLRYWQLPGNPLDFPDSVKAATGMRTPTMFNMGCPSDGGWAAQAFDAMERAAKTDPELGRRFYPGIGISLSIDRKDNKFDWCPADHDRIIRLLTAELRRRHEAKEPDVLLSLLLILEVADNADTYAAVRAVMHDATLQDLTRGRALSTLRTMRQRMYGETPKEIGEAIAAEARRAGAALPCGRPDHCGTAGRRRIGPTLPDTLRND